MALLQIETNLRHFSGRAVFVSIINIHRKTFARNQKVAKNGETKES